MFNVTKSLKKLDEVYEKSIIPSPVIKHIREILLAGQEDEPEKPVTEENTCCCYGSGTCSYCRNKKYDKPSEFISIPRDVAEKAINGGWIDFCNLWNAIKQALKG